MFTRQTRASALLAIVGAAFSLGGCGLPLSGPRGEAVLHSASVQVEADAAPLPYCLVPVTPSVLDIALKNGPRLTGSLNDNRKRRNTRIGVGDVVSVTLFEAASGGLFFSSEGGARQGNVITLPNQRVDNDGNIAVPYAGSIRAAGQTVSSIRDAIVEALKARAIEPQAVVTLVEQNADLITVLGEVGTPSRLPSRPSGERVLDAISRAGGLRGPGQESWIILDRAGSTQVVPFEAVIRDPSNNINVQPQDTLYVYREAQTFLAFGATTRQGQIPFDAWRISLSEALAKAGGFIDTQAEPAWVFLYRNERRHVVEKIDPHCLVTDGPLVPVIYRANLRDPSGYFLSTQFPMRNKDVVYVANSKTVEETKFMNFLRTVNGTIQDPIQTAISGYTLRSLVRGTTSTVIIPGAGTGTGATP